MGHSCVKPHPGPRRGRVYKLLEPRRSYGCGGMRLGWNGCDGGIDWTNNTWALLLSDVLQNPLLVDLKSPCDTGNSSYLCSFTDEQMKFQRSYALPKVSLEISPLIRPALFF